MSEQKILNPWPVWIDKRRKFISVREYPNGEKILFASRQIGVKMIAELAMKGYKVG
ncbi:MAG: hypothetical protein J6N52_02635 [Clostridia bacterium]|nr:hypothetical protein [Clostridia bacterium]